MKYVVNSHTITYLLIPQIERFAGKYMFTKLNMRAIETALSAMVARCDNPKQTWGIIE